MKNQPVLKLKTIYFCLLLLSSQLQKTGSQDLRDGEARAPSCCMDRSGVPWLSAKEVQGQCICWPSSAQSLLSDLDHQWRHNLVAVIFRETVAGAKENLPFLVLEYLTMFHYESSFCNFEFIYEFGCSTF